MKRPLRVGLKFQQRGVVMSDLIKQLLTSPRYLKIIQQNLPSAFQTVEDELKGNPAVGLLREQVILGMLVAFLGEEKVELVPSGVNPDIDCYVDSKPLSIKTVSSSSGIRLKWTSNAVKAKEFIDSYKPTSDLLVVRIIWRELGGILFIPLDIQQHVFSQIGVTRYLDYRGTTNTRGVNLSPEAERAFYRHPRMVNLPILWKRTEETINPISKWIDYWREKDKS